MSHEIEPTLNTWSVSFLVAFRDLGGNDLTELPPGAFDSLVAIGALCAKPLFFQFIFLSLFLFPPPLSK